MSNALESALTKTLRWTPLMSGLTDEQFQRVLSLTEALEYELGDQIDCGDLRAPALCILISGSMRVANNHDRGDKTLFFIKEFGSIFSNEISQQADVSDCAVYAAESTKILRLDAAGLKELKSQSSSATQKLAQESKIFLVFTKLRSTRRFSSLPFWQFRPILSQADLVRFGKGETFANIDKPGLFIVIDGAIRSGEADNAHGTMLQPGDWFAHGHVLPDSPFIKHTADEVAVSQGELLHISEDAYLKLADVTPELVSQLNMLLLSETIYPDMSAREVENGAPKILGRVPKVNPTIPEPVRSVPVDQESAIPKARRRLKQYPHVYQHSELECGITCLHMICLFYGKKVSLTQLRELCEIGRSGTSMLELAEAAEQLGFISRGVRATYAGLAKLRLPAILYWRRNHFVVLYELHQDHALIGDPAEGLIKLDATKFRREFSEHALELSPTVQWFDTRIENKPIWHTLMPILLPHKALLRDVLLCSGFFQLLLLATPIFTQIVLDQVVVHQDLDTLNIMLLGMIFLTLFQASIGYLRQFFLAFLSLKADQGLFTELLKRLLDLPLEYFSKHATGDTLTRFGEGAGVVQFLTGIGATAMLDVVMAVLFLAVVYIYNLTFGLVATAYALALITFLFLCAPALKKLSQRAYDKQIAAESYLVESIKGIERVKAAAAEHRCRWKWESLFLEKLNVRLQEVIAVSGVSTLTRLVQLAAQINFLWLGAHMIINHELTIGQLMAMTMLMSMILQPFLRLADLAQLFQQINVATERLVEIFVEKPEETDPTAKIHLADVQGDIKFDKVTYRYPGREGGNALTNVSFLAKPGQMIGIVGRSGSGKTTLTRLLQGLYQPTSGRIFVDGHDLSQIALSTYRRRIGVVSQNEYYFRGTVRENIAFHKPDATLEEIVNACTTAGINDLLASLPSGYETVLNEGAENFSGGQRQCMAIARAILHEPSILIFDEATSAMDSETERLINDCMERLRARSTMFVVAHRLSTVMNADLILVIDQGQLVESGTHESLMAQKGLYYYLCKKQALSM